MRDYLNSKIIEYSILLDWVEHEIDSLKGRSKNHCYLIGCLQDKIAELHKSLDRLRVITRIESPHLTRRALPIIHELEYHMWVITSHYIPALQRENKNDLFLRSILLSAARRCGLSWIRDILVRLDGQYAIFPALTEIPVIFAPPQQCMTLLDMAGFYHEFGHNVFQRFKKITDDLTATVSEYFLELRRDVGPMSQGKREKRSHAIENAINYWGIERLNEIFSDIYATFVCGPIYYFSCTDMAIRTGGNLFRVDATDVHPPWATRVYACYKTLLPIYQSDEMIILIKDNLWSTCIDIRQKHPDFDIVCPSTLIDQLVDMAKQDIEQLLPDAQPFSEPVPNSSELKEISPSETLESILNKRLKIFLTEPENCGEWEKKVFKILQTHNRDR